MKDTVLKRESPELSERIIASFLTVCSREPKMNE